jgi:hypothetical protein
VIRPLITTGTFTADAKKEVTRDVPPIDLIDGDRSVNSQRYDLGVRTTTCTVEDVRIDAASSPTSSNLDIRWLLAIVRLGRVASGMKWQIRKLEHLVII